MPRPLLECWTLLVVGYQGGGGDGGGGGAMTVVHSKGKEFFSLMYFLELSVVVIESRLTESWFCYSFKILCMQCSILLSAPRSMRKWEKWGKEERASKKWLLLWATGADSHWGPSKKLGGHASEPSLQRKGGWDSYIPTSIPHWLGIWGSIPFLGWACLLSRKFHSIEGPQVDR